MLVLRQLHLHQLKGHHHGAPRDPIREPAPSDCMTGNHQRAGYECMTQPPSTLIVWPVTWEARSDERNTTMSAISRGSCQRPKGTRVRTFSPAQSSYDRFRSIGC